MSEFSPDQVADKFRSVIFDWLGAETCREVDARNKSYEPACCATHDFCDANMAMDEAMTGLGVYSDFFEDGNTEEVTALWNKAWDIARNKGFSRPN